MAVLAVGDAQAPPQNGVAPPSDPFYYGYRIKEVYDEAGNVEYIYIPLAQAEFLDPQDGDYFVQGTLHEDDREDLKAIFRFLHRDNPTMTVFSDLKMVWSIEGLSEPAPDVAVVPNVVEPEKPRGSFDVTNEETRPRFVLEVVSPRYVKPDLQEKAPIYERARVEEYFIIDSGLCEWREEISYSVLGYRLQRGKYVKIQPDARGWIFSEVNQVWVGATEAHDDYLVVDARTGERILPDRERFQVAEQRAEVAEQRAESAERMAQIEAAARAEAEQRLRELEAEVARLRASQSG